MSVSAVEDLYQEHGILNRLLLIYEEFINRKIINKKLLLATALIVKKFVEEYHEMSEETYIFPLIKDKKLVKELIKQHTISRGITSKILEWCRLDTSKVNIYELLKSFVYMYRFHESREDTEIFPEIKKVLSKEAYEKLGDDMEKEEDIKLGEGGFKYVLKSVKFIERELGIFELEDITKDILKKLKY